MATGRHQPQTHRPSASRAATLLYAWKSSPRTVSPLAALGAATVPYAWWATELETFSTESTVAILTGGAVALSAGTWRRLRSPRDPDTSRARRQDRPAQDEGEPGQAHPGRRAWLVLLAVLAAWQTQAFVQSPREDHPTISSIVNTVLATDAARTLACAAWIVGAYRLARRQPPSATAARSDGRTSRETTP